MPPPGPGRQVGRVVSTLERVVVVYYLHLVLPARPVLPTHPTLPALSAPRLLGRHIHVEILLGRRQQAIRRNLVEAALLLVGLPRRLATGNSSISVRHVPDELSHGGAVL